MKWNSKYTSAFSCKVCVFITLLVSGCAENTSRVEVPELDSTLLRILAESPSHTVLSEQATVTFGDVTLADTIVMSGTIVPDERRINFVSSRVSGRIEKLYIRFPYQYVRKGQKLLDIYSPELTTAINEHIFLFTKDSASTLALESRKRLLLLGLSNAQINESERSGEAPLVISIYSSYEGYALTSDENFAEPSTMNLLPVPNPMSMNKSGNNSEISSSELIREGSYVLAGQKLFSINDAKKVIALLTVTGGLQAQLQPGDSITVRSELLPGKDIQGTVSLVEPSLQARQKFLYVRVELPNPHGELKYNSLVSARLPLERGTVNRLPASCVYDLGTRRIVWVKSGQADSAFVFTPRIVITGNTTEGYTEIISGINPGDMIALEAGLMTDRDGIIQTELR